MTIQVGEATVQRLLDGTRIVLRADKFIRVSVDLLRSGRLEEIEPDGTIVLDSAGEYRYRFLVAQDEDIHIYQRVTEPTGFAVGVTAIVSGHAVHPPGTVLQAP